MAVAREYRNRLLRSRSLLSEEFSYETRPALIVRRGSNGFEIENVGQTTAVGITLNLVERAARPTGKLHVGGILRPAETSGIFATDWPEELKPELAERPASFEERIRRLHGEEVQQYDGERVASHLLTRPGRQILILRFRILDGSKTYVRLFSPARKREQRPLEVLPTHPLMQNRIFASTIEKWHASKSQFRPPFDFSKIRENREGVSGHSR